MSNDDLIQRICYAASDYRMAHENDGFANEFGGLDALRNELFSLVEQWEMAPEPAPEPAP